MGKNIKVTFVHHSCFCVENEECSMIFDYWKKDLPAFDKNKPLYVFSSHAHGDHFNPSVFKLREEYPDVTFILSDDIKTADADDIVRVEPHKEYVVGNIRIKTYFSTDEGVAFLVESDERRYLHFGDLNWWHWEGEPDKFNREQETYFKREVDSMKGDIIDIAFGPALDKRLLPNHWWGLNYFARTADVRLIFPMHFFESYEVCREVMAMEETVPYRDRMVEITGSGQCFELEI